MEKKKPMGEVRAGILTGLYEKIERLTNENKGLADALEKITVWMERQADHDEREGKNCRFESLAKAYSADCKNYRAMAKQARAALKEAGR